MKLEIMLLKEIHSTIWKNSWRGFVWMVTPQVFAIKLKSLNTLASEILPQNGLNLSFSQLFFFL